ncbi:hypothetical protein HDU97_003844 [Phlyctochytrium planicorne]|nr:hypothetical protein HDU97_003844 [Phlyctochytrium planicorne]
MSPTPNDAFVRKSLTTIFIALLIDILAFTIILPLLPRLLDHYEKTDGQDKNSFFYLILTWIRQFRTAIGGTGSRMDIVLFGGIVGSLFSFLQFVSSPFIGSLSDRYGRKNVLLISMIGNAISMLLWIFSKSFVVFVLSRVVGGLTEGNVQMSIAMISDITTEQTRSRGLALVGIAFSLGFTVGPPLGAYFASLDLIKLFPFLEAYSVNSYSSPALFAFVLIIVETVYMAIALPETLNFKKTSPPSKATTASEESKPLLKKAEAGSPLKGKALLWRLSLIHFLFLFLFSGMEFTLTFLTHDRFHFTHLEQGKYLGYIGIVTALVQGGYVRRVAHRSVSEKTLVIQGIITCGLGLGILGAFATTRLWLYVGATFLAFTSGTVVTSLTSLASLVGNSSEGTQDAGALPHPDESKQGKILGEFRSLGQLGRSIGPLLACSGYWVLGSKAAYTIYAASMFFVAFLAMTIIPTTPLKKKVLKAE